MEREDFDADYLPPMTAAEEAEMQKEIDLAMAPYEKIAPKSLLPEMRASLERALRTHPAPRSFLRAFVPRAEVVASGDAAVGGSAEDNEKAARKEGA
jgi:hypothetical protein